MVGRTVTRAELYDAAYQAAGVSKREASELVELLLTEIVNGLARGETVKVASFGTFTTRRKAGRVGRNPKTGAAAPISPRTVVVFRPSQILKERVRHALAENELPVQRLSSLPAPRPAAGRE
jgi:integration host factor subunit alpha